MNEQSIDEQVEMLLAKIANVAKEVDWELKGYLIRVVGTNQCPLEFVAGLEGGTLNKDSCSILNVDRDALIMVVNAADSYFSCRDKKTKEVNERLREITGLKKTA